MKLDAIETVTELLLEFIGDIDPGSAKGRRRRRILEVATDLFSEQGYRRTSISSVAAKAHIAKATVYLYFATKSELLLASTAWEKLKMLDAFRPLLRPEVEPRARLRGWIAQMFLQNSRSRLLSRLICGDDELESVLMEVRSPLLDRSEKIGREIFGQLVADATGESSTDAELRAQITAIRMLLFAAPHLASAHLRQGVPAEPLAEMIASMIVDGIGRPARSAPA